MNSLKKGFKTVTVDFVDRAHGTSFPETRPRKPHSALPVDDVDFLTGTDIHQSSKYMLLANLLLGDLIYW